VTTRVALVTGCGKRDGMGRAIAHRLAGAGLAVLVTDREKAGVLNTRQERAGVPERNRWDGLDELVTEIRAAGGTVGSALGDIADPDAAERPTRSAGSTCWSTTPPRRRARTAPTSSRCRSRSGTG
jgi:3-oxoacyl-[acyl-carrier protein] reductase